MARSIEAQLDAAERRGAVFFETEPRALEAFYDAASQRITINLVNGCTYVFPAALVQDLKGARQEDLERLEIDGLGFNLHWPALDVDLLVPALVAGIFGTRRWMHKDAVHLA